MVLPDEDKYSTTRNEMLDQLAYMLGGRAAEELVFHDPTTGAANDIEKATATARAMVTQYGMTERLGAIKFGGDNSEPFLGREMGHQRDYSEEVAALVDEEVKKLIETAHNEAWEILVENRDVLDNLVLAAAGEGDAGQGGDRRGLRPDRQAPGPARRGPVPRGVRPPPVRRCSHPRSWLTRTERRDAERSTRQPATEIGPRESEAVAERAIRGELTRPCVTAHSGPGMNAAPPRF